MLRVLFVVVLLFISTCATVMAQADRSSADFMRYDLDKATLDELQAIAAQEGLEPQNGTEALRRQLYNHFKLEPLPSGIMTIEQAQRLVSGPAGLLQQRLTIIEDGVRISVKEGNTRHIISANRIEINSDTETINAFGQVEYITGEGANEQRFSADSFIFSSKTFQALVIGVDGRVTQPNQQGGEDTFYLKANSMIKGTDDLIILDNVVVTSCDNENPHYRIKVGRMWNLGNNTWAAKNLIFYLGHFPLVYLPIYYQGNFFFNPVLSYESRRGLSINTTTYFIGGKEASGLFNFNLMNNSHKKQSTASLKLMADYYTKMGYYVGLGASESRANFTMQFGLGYSNTIFADGTTIDPTTMDVDHNSSYFLGRLIPLRYGLQNDLNVQKVKIHIDFFSDPSFVGDFWNRSENAIFFSYLLGADGNFMSNEDATTRLYQTASTISYANSFSFNNKVVKYVNIDYLSLDYVQRAKVAKYLGVTPPFESANYEFYVPSRVNFPNTRFEFGARWFPVRGQAAESEVAVGVEEPTAVDLNSPLIPTAFLTPYVDRIWEPSFFYKIIASERIFWEPDTYQWQNPTYIEYNSNDIRSFTSGNLALGLELNTTDNFFNFKTGVDGNIVYQQRFGGDEDKTTNKNNWIGDELNRLYNLNNTVSLTFNPFPQNERLRKSFLNYNLDNRFYNNSYNRSEDKRISQWQFNPTRHLTTGLLRYDTGLWWTFAGGRLQLPKMATQGESESGVGLLVGGFSNQASIYIKHYENANDSTGYALRSEYKPVSFFSVGQNSEFDFKDTFHYNDVYLKFFWFRATQVWEKRAIYEWDSTSYIWTAVPDPNTGKQKFNYVMSYLDLRIDGEQTFKPIWNNRVQFKLKLDSGWKIDWHKYNDSLLTNRLGFGFNLYKIFDFMISVNSANRATYLYLPFMRDKMGLTQKFSFWQDLGYSFMFWDKKKQQESRFKLENFTIDLHIDLHDWDVYVQYLGKPRTYSGGIDPNRLWSNSFTFFVVWKPFPSFKTPISHENDHWHLGELIGN